MVVKKFTVDSFAEQKGITRQSALNLLSRLKKRNLVNVSGGGRQPRIYTLYTLPKKKTNGFYDLINTYAPDKLQPKFEHYVNGRYTVERAIIDGIIIGDSRTLDATMHLFRHVTDWKRLFDMAEKKNLKPEVIELYNKARLVIKSKKMPERYLR